MNSRPSFTLLQKVVRQETETLNLTPLNFVTLQGKR